MIPVPANVRVWIATGHSDMRQGMNGLALQVQEALSRDPHLCGGSDYVAELPLEAACAASQTSCSMICISGTS